MRFVQIICFIIISVSSQPSSAADITTTCPSSYVEGVASQVNCTIDLTAFSAARCANSPDELSFYFTPKGSSAEQVWCSTSIQSCSTKHRKDDACNNCSCGCLDDSTSSAAKYRLIFTPEQQTHAGGTFSCSITCFELPGTKEPSSSNNNCAPIGAIRPPQPPPGTPQPPPDGGCSTLCGIGIGVGVVVVSIIIIIIIVIVVKRGRRQPENYERPPEETPVFGQDGKNQDGSNSKPAPAIV